MTLGCITLIIIGILLLTNLIYWIINIDTIEDTGLFGTLSVIISGLTVLVMFSAIIWFIVLIMLKYWDAIIF